VAVRSEPLPWPAPALVAGDAGVRLRPWRQADLDDAHAAVQDPLVGRFIRVPRLTERASIVAFHAEQEPRRLAGEELVLAIADAASDRFLGTMSLLRIVWSERRSEIGYWLAPWGRGRGAASASAALLGRWALATLALDRVEALIDPVNEASQRVVLRAGFVGGGVLRPFTAPDGTTRDHLVFALTRGDGAAQPS
jgi:RimJ/RimL family protein N-acetyltransferase